MEALAGGPSPVDRDLQSASMEACANAMFIADRAGRIHWVNRAFTELYGYPAAEVLGKTPRLLKSGRQSASFYADLWRTIASGSVWRGQLANRKASGEVVDVEQTITPVCSATGKVTHYLAVYENITHRLRSEQHLARLALFDSLTGLANRYHLERRLGEALQRARRSRRPVGLMMIDLDHFKQVNDSVGHAAGDELLVQAGRRMIACLRQADLVARLSGDEFAVLLEDLQRPEEAADGAQRIITALQTPFDIEGHPVKVGASIGIAIAYDGNTSSEDLLRHADLAMYQSKAMGRGQFEFFDTAMDAAARRRFTTEAALRKALREDALELVYQPIVDLADRRILAAEALLRWTDPVRGPVSPDEFVELAEQTGLIFALNDWVLARVAREIAHWTPGLRVPVAVNLSAGHFDKVGLATNVQRLLAQHDLPPSALRIEITETLMLKPSPTVTDNLRELSALGVSLGVDDFGTGYSALPALRRFPIGYIKLDHSYVGAIGRAPRDEQFVEAIIGLARVLGLGLVAEGVETLEQAAFLQRHGCTEAQGFLFSRGVRIAELTEMLRAGQRQIASAN